MNHLQGDDAIEADVPCLVDNAHAALAKFRQDLILSNTDGSRRRNPGAGVAWLDRPSSVGGTSGGAEQSGRGTGGQRQVFAGSPFVGNCYI